MFLGSLDVFTKCKYIILVNYEWDEAKNRANIRRHKIDFVDVPAIFEKPMVVFLDNRKNYGEDRMVGIGVLKGIAVVVVFTEPNDDQI